MRRLVSSAMIVSLFSFFGPPAAQAASPYETWQTIKNSVVLIGWKQGDGKFVSYGTGFCLYSNSRTSYFLTNQHVVASPGASQPTQLVVILPTQISQRYPATVVRTNADRDLAIVSIDVGNVPALRLSKTLPEPLQPVAWGGYPYAEGTLWAGLTGQQTSLARTPELVASVHTGEVSALHQGDYYIQFDGNLDHGNSGGPLFDPDTGAVYGVLEGYLPGSSGSDAVATTDNDLAISMSEALSLLKQPPSVSVAFVQSQGSGDQVTEQAYTNAAHGSKECRLGLEDFARAYGAWSQAHGLVLTVAHAWRNDPNGRPTEDRADAIATTYAHLETKWLDAMTSAIATLRHASDGSNAADYAQALLDEATKVNQADLTLAASISSDDALQAVQTAEGPLSTAAGKMHDLGTCEQ